MCLCEESRLFFPKRNFSGFRLVRLNTCSDLHSSVLLGLSVGRGWFTQISLDECVSNQYQ